MNQQQEQTNTQECYAAGRPQLDNHSNASTSSTRIEAPSELQNNSTSQPASEPSAAGRKRPLEPVDTSEPAGHRHEASSVASSPSGTPTRADDQAGGATLPKNVDTRIGGPFDSSAQSTNARPAPNLDQNNSNSSSGCGGAHSAQGDSERRYRPQKYCAVCGDKAIACNFNAVTCESCKAFFRRNAFKEQRLKCLFENSCIIDRVTRRFCSKCRLLKCFQIGMKREWILTDEQKQIKRVKIMQNKKSRQQVSAAGSPNFSEDSSPRLAELGASHSTNEPVAITRSLADLQPLTQVPKSQPKVVHNGTTRKSIINKSKPDANYSQQIAESAPTVVRSGTGCACKRPEMRDASTACPDEADLLNPAGLILHHCSLALQCQYCSLRLFGTGPHSNAPYQHLGHHKSSAMLNLHHSHAHHHNFVHNQDQSPSHQAHYQAHRLATYATPPLQSQQLVVGYPNAHQHAHRTDQIHPPPVHPDQLAAARGPPVNELPTCCCPDQSQTGHFTLGHPPDAPLQLAITTRTPPIEALVGDQQMGSPPNLQPHLHVMTPPEPELRPSLPPTSTHHGAQATIPNGQLPSSAALQSTTVTDQNMLGQIMVRSDQSATSLRPIVVETSLADNLAENQVNSRPASSDEATTASQAPEPVGPSVSFRPNGASTDLDLDNDSCIVYKGDVYCSPAHTQAQMMARVERLDFNPNERELLYEMIEAFKFLFEHSSERLTNTRGQLTDIVHFCDAALRKLIKTLKQIRAFRILSMDDQIVLLKTACFKILLLRSTFHYHEELEGWVDVKSGGLMRLDVLKRAKKSFVYERHYDLVDKIAEPLRKDRIIMIIMSLALLFDPNINLKHSNSVQLDNLVYLSILRKYLLITQPDPLTKYESLVRALDVINACNDEYNVFFTKDFQPEQITPLLVEIFDISINEPMR